MVEWVDSHTNQGWELKAEQDPFTEMRVHSVGWVVYEDELVLTLAPHNCRNQYCDTMTIPRVCIKRVRNIR